MFFIDYNFYVSQDIIIFDRELDPKSVFEKMGIDDNTLCTLVDNNGRLELHVVYEDDYDPDPEKQEEIDYTLRLVSWINPLD